jgi:putative inorganic carbon (HCO3(-)) transporter
MITEVLYLVSYLILLPIAFMFPFGGALAYEWLQYMPPNSVYNAGAFSNLSLIIGVVSLGVLSIFYFLKSKRKLIFLMILPLFGALFYFVAPAGSFDRMNTISDTTESSSAGRIDAWEWGWKFALDHPITGGGYHSFILHQTGTIDNPGYLEAHNIFFETMADHGFVGLGLLIALILGMIINCLTMAKRAKKVPDLAWAANLGTMLQLAMWTFIAGSQFLADATQSMPYELCALSMAARGIVERRLAQEPKNVLTTNLGMGKTAPAALPGVAGVPGLVPRPVGGRIGARAPAYGARRT